MDSASDPRGRTGALAAMDSASDPRGRTRASVLVTVLVVMDGAHKPESSEAAGEEIPGSRQRKEKGSTTVFNPRRGLRTCRRRAREVEAAASGASSAASRLR